MAVSSEMLAQIEFEEVLSQKETNRGIVLNITVPLHALAEKLFPAIRVGVMEILIMR